MIPEVVNICGIPHRVILCEDGFTGDGRHLGEISYLNCEIRINKNMPETLQRQTLIHEMVHGMLFMQGLDRINDDEEKVNVIANAIYHGFDIKQGKENKDDRVQSKEDEGDHEEDRRAV